MTAQGFALVFSSYYAYQWFSGGLDLQEDMYSVPDPTSLNIPGDKSE
jgi:hypothetical protein